MFLMCCISMNIFEQYLNKQFNNLVFDKYLKHSGNLNNVHGLQIIYVCLK